MLENKPFCLFADCEILYDGRATSTLERGNYLVVYKADGSVSIHGSTHVMPRNYISSGSKLRVDQDTIVFARKQETVTIKVHQILNLLYPDNWSQSKIVICRTEKELARKIFDNWCDYFDGDFEIIQLEYPTDLGPIDIVGMTTTTDFIVEVKRKRAVLKDVTQLRRYIEAMEHRDRPFRAFLAAPDIAKNAAKYLDKHGLSFLEVNFDVVRPS